MPARIIICLLAIATTIQAATFNVKDYGAAGDDKTDNTAAFSKCIDAMIAAGGGQMFIPDGVYRGRIIIPPVAKPMSSWMTLEIVGESSPSPVFGTIGNFPLRDHGTILKCLEKDGPAVISASQTANSLYGGFTATWSLVH